MRHGREILLWTLVTIISILTFVWVFPQAFPFFQPDWTITREEAKAIALERMRSLGEPIEDPYLVVEFDSDNRIDRQLQQAWGTFDPEALRQSQLQRSIVTWQVRLFEPDALPRDWKYWCLISRTGDVLGLIEQNPEGELTQQEIDEEQAIRVATEYLEKEGFDLKGFEAQPTFQRMETAKRQEARVRFRWKERILDERHHNGVEVWFAGSKLGGFISFYEDPEPETTQAFFRQTEFLEVVQALLFYSLLPFVIVPFLKRYHDGQLGVRRGVQFFVVFWAAGILFLFFCARQITSGVNLSFMTREQTTWLAGLWILIFFLSVNGALALMSWAVGESFCRQIWPQKLASIDAIFRGRWTNATVAHAALRGVAGGTAMAALTLLLNRGMHEVDAWTLNAELFSNGLSAALPGLALVAAKLSFDLPIYLLACFLIPCWLGLKLGPNLSIVPSWLLASLLLTPLVLALPAGWGFLAWLPVAAIPVLLFRFGDLLSSMLAGLVAATLIAVYPLLLAGDPFLQLNGWGALLLVASPLVFSLRYLGTSQEFLYTYDDIPPHVRRIAERERQRMELETAAQIQTSILPQLPPQLNGIEVAHTYLPASEVGGDFYDVLALDDGRLAVAVGDVAGHGVSSGLVMSMAKSALAVQVSFDPEVESVLHTLNRMVYQSARQRLLTTLCYAVIDPKIRELYYASAGHLYPYLVSSNGEVKALEESSYPLGVRDQIRVQTRTNKLEPGDSIFLYSDGLVEARPENSEELFGFTRLEASLERHAGKPPAEMRDAVLGDVHTFAGHERHDDDLTVLVLRLPAA